jgi:hypothetical protein
MELYDSIPITIPKKNPYSPLQKTSYIKLKLEAKNLDKAIINANNLNLNDFKKAQNLSYNINLQPYAIVSINDIEKQTEVSKSNSPQWTAAIEHKIKDPKCDNILILINTKSSAGFNPNPDFISDHHSDNFVCFQMIPVNYLEKGGYVGKPESLWLRLLTTKPDDYFIRDTKHDPEQYRKTDKQAEKESK